MAAGGLLSLRVARWLTTARLGPCPSTRPGLALSKKHRANERAWVELLRAIAGHGLTGGPRGWLAACRFCILLIVLILDQ